MNPRVRQFFLDCAESLNLRNDEFEMDSSWCHVWINNCSKPLHFEWHFWGRHYDQLEVGIHSESTPHKNRYYVEHLFAMHQKGLERDLEMKVIIQPDWGTRKHWSRMFVLKKSPALDRELVEWAVNTMCVFRRTIGPTLG